MSQEVTKARNYWGYYRGYAMLTDTACRTAKPRERDYKISDSGGLYLFVTKAGYKSWRLKYRIAKSEKVLTIGPYPDISLAEARTERERAKRMIREGIDPSARKKQEALTKTQANAGTFRTIALDWFAAKKGGWSQSYYHQVVRILEADVFPTIGALNISEITPPQVLLIIRGIEKRGSMAIAKMARTHMSAVFTHGIASGLCTIDPAAMVRPALQSYIPRHVAALSRIEDARTFLQRVEQSPNIPVMIKLMSRLVALTAVRSSAARLAEHQEFIDLHGSNPTWIIPAAKMKLTKNRKNNPAFDFSVPLSKQAAETVAAAMSIRGRNGWLFPSGRMLDSSYSEVTLSHAYQKASTGLKLVPHGWRATFSTIMNERAAKAGRDSDRPIIDMMLAHMTNTVEVTYNRAAYMDRRREIAQEWADLLTDGLVPASDLLPK